MDAHLAECLKWKSASRLFQPGEDPSIKYRGLLRDCETFTDGSFEALYLTLKRAHCQPTAARPTIKVKPARLGRGGAETGGSGGILLDNWLLVIPRLVTPSSAPRHHRGSCGASDRGAADRGHHGGAASSLQWKLEDAQGDIFNAACLLMFSCFPTLSPPPCHVSCLAC